MTLMEKCITLKNDLWEVEIMPEWNGRVVGLRDRRTGTVCVKAPDDAAECAGEVGSPSFFGLEWWTKSGEGQDPATGVLPAFAAIHRAPVDVEIRSDGAVFRARHGGMVLEMNWSLLAGDAPLTCRVRLVNETALSAVFQFEGFFCWHCPAEVRGQTVVSVPGIEAFCPAPYLEVRFGASDDLDSPGTCAAWWRDDGGVALRAGEDVQRFFYGLDFDRFVLGAHSRARRLAPGEEVTATLEIAPLAWARAQAWPIDVQAIETLLARQQRDRRRCAHDTSGVQAWASAPSPRFSRRALHLVRTPTALGEAISSLKRIIPAGFNTLMLEIDNAYPYRSHPEIVPEWAWSRAEWDEYVRNARDLGLEIIPVINALGHQTETGLALAHADMREDPDGWSLCPRHPRTLPYVIDLIDELVDWIQPRVFHVGLDEVDMSNRAQTFCVCPRCREADGGELFADHVTGLHAHITALGLEMMMWPDMLFADPRQNHVNGRRTGTWRAIDRLPRDIIMADWVYGVTRAYAGTEYLLEHGFRVLGATWNSPRAVADFSRFAADHDLYGMCATTWSGLLMNNWPLDCVLLAGKYFQDPYFPEFDRAAAEAIALAYALLDA